MRTRLRLIAPVTLTVIAILGLSLEPAIGNRIGKEHLPNLRTRRPIGLEITHENGAKLLRFTNTVANVGAGPLEMRPDNSDGTTTDAYQRVYTHDNSMTWQFMYERLVGTFVFHPQHNHWHFEAFAAYELHAVATDGSVGGIVAQGQDKVSFCLGDSVAVNKSLEHFKPQPVYPLTCSQNATQGISVGWGDRYGRNLYGQWIDITGLADGTYWLTSEADPLNLILETKDSDNRYSLKIRITGDTVALL